MKTIIKDIVSDIINTQFAYATKKEKAETFIEAIVKDITEPTVMLIDLTNATIDHYFCEAFGHVYDQSFDFSNQIDVIFKLHDYQLNNLLKGLMAHKKIPFSAQKNGDLLIYFKENTPGIKVKFSTQNDLTFLINIDEKSKKILTYINDKKTTDSINIYQDTQVGSMEDLVPLLEDLVKKRMIYRDEEKNYNSVDNILNF